MSDREHIKCLWLFLIGAVIGFLIVTTLCSTSVVEALCVSGTGMWAVHTATIGWTAGVNPNNALIQILPANSTLTSIIGNVETATGGTATVSVNIAASGTPCSAGTTVYSGSFNANGTAATNQTLTLTTTAVTSPARLCLQTTGTTTWTGGITVTYTTPAYRRFLIVAVL